jgi:hypothetical protein
MPAPAPAPITAPIATLGQMVFQHDGSLGSFNM